MSDDIVTRLQDGLFYEVWDDAGIHWQTEIKNKDIWDAIKEIKCLREQVTAWKDLAQELTMYAAMQEMTEGLNG
jgi:hypothetical protein